MDRRMHSAACERNRDPILGVLQEALPARGLVLEIASGTGMHAVYFAARFPALAWQPTDPDAQSLVSIAAWREAEPAPNLREPLQLDVVDERWPIDRADAIFVANMLHISPWTSGLGLFQGAARVLSAPAPLVIYGPFMRSGQHTAPSNEAFDHSLRERNALWGIRDLQDVTRAANDAGFHLERSVEMPANNMTLIFRRT